MALSSRSVSERNLNRPPREGRRINPGKGAFTAFEFMLDDPAPRFFDNMVASISKLCEQG